MKEWDLYSVAKAQALAGVIVNTSHYQDTA
jgi:hypothetical protein